MIPEIGSRIRDDDQLVPELYTVGNAEQTHVELRAAMLSYKARAAKRLLCQVTELDSKNVEAP